MPILLRCVPTHHGRTGTRTGLCAATSAPGLKSASARAVERWLAFVPHRHREWTLPCQHLRRELAPPNTHAHTHTHTCARARACTHTHTHTRARPPAYTHIRRPSARRLRLYAPEPSRQGDSTTPSRRTHTHTRAPARAQTSMQTLKRKYARTHVSHTHTSSSNAILLGLKRRAPRPEDE